MAMSSVGAASAIRLRDNVLPLPRSVEPSASKTGSRVQLLLCGRVAAQGRLSVGHKSFDDLCPSRFDSAGRANERDANVVLPTPRHATGRFKSVKLDDEREGFWDCNRSINAEARSIQTEIAHGAGQGGISLVEGHDTSLQHAPAGLAPHFTTSARCRGIEGVAC
jgi:hypothetical protein